MNSDVETSGVLDDYLTENELAVELDRSPRTLARWRNIGVGPPVTKVGRDLLYRRGGVRDWLLSREREQVRAVTA